MCIMCCPARQQPMPVMRACLIRSFAEASQMAIWCICFDLLPEPMPDVAPGIRGAMRDAFPDIPQALEVLGPAIRVTPSAWLLSSDLSADQIMDRLHPHVLNT